MWMLKQTRKAHTIGRGSSYRGNGSEAVTPFQLDAELMGSDGVIL